ncbi:hypothetical protein VTN02DRAFT_2814 [Thermoascus thermophilus]
MDFPGVATTNIRIIDGFSNIYWRIYTEESASATLSPEGVANGYAILKHLSRLKDLELRLRNLDCLVSCYPRRFGLWVFSATPDFESLSPLCPNGSSGESHRLLVGSASLKVSASGSTTAVELIKTLSPDPPTHAAGSSGSQKAANVAAPARPGDGQGNSAAVYASFISAVAGAICLQLIRRHNAIPLGTRTLFTAIDTNGYDSPTILNDNPASVPSLTTIRVELIPPGKLIVSLHTISQPGITRLWAPAGRLHIADAQPDTDLCLSPNGTVGRLVTTNIAQSTAPSPSLPNSHAMESETSRRMLEIKRKQWKVSVLEWLGNAGLSVDSIEDEAWVEVEVTEPFYARLAAESWRQGDSTQPPYPLKRILWPAKYCFRRTQAASPTSYHGLGDSIADDLDPLEFAEQWFLAASSRNEALSKDTDVPQAQQAKVQEMSPPKTDVLEGIESLARIPQFPDLQAASLVYPTPPDGAAAQGSSKDMFSEGSDLGPSKAQKEGSVKPSEHVSSKDRPESVVMTGFGPSRGLAVGSGFYDTIDDDDDLFGEMNEKDFGSRGISDADFSFFDEPDFGALGGDKTMEDVQDSQQQDIQVAEVEPIKSTELALAENASSSHKDTGGHEEDVKKPANDGGESKPSLHLGGSDITRNEMEGPSEHPSPEEQGQEPSPPLSPMEIKRILFSESRPDEGTQEAGRTRLDSHGPDKRSRKQSRYDPVPFQQNLRSWEQKYGADGMFWRTPATGASAPVDANGDIPTVGFPQHERKIRSVPRGQTNAASTDHGTPLSSIPVDVHSASVSSDEMSDDSSEIVSERAPSPTITTNLKRKRPISEAEESTTSSLEQLSISGDPDAAASREDNSAFLGNFLSAFSDWSLIGYFSIRQSQISPVLIRKEDQIQLAQLMVDQLTQSSLNHKLDGHVGLPDLESDAFSLRTFLEDTSVMGEIVRLDLKGYVTLQDSTIAQPTNEGLPPRQAAQRKDLKGSITKLPPPHLRVRRGKDYLELLPPAIPFWETFGLEPANGEKDILAYCIHPHNAAEGADAFLERLSLLYSSCNLGKHVRGDKLERGLGSWKVNFSGESGYFSTMQSLIALCERLGTLLSKSPPSRDNFVIYIINPFSHGAAIADICSAFLQIFQKYVGDVDRQHARQLNELVLQIIPMDFVSSPVTLVVPTQAEYLNLALEVYNRCPPRDPASSAMGCAPPVVLAEPVPKVINFRLSSERHSPLQEGKCLHLAFSRSADQRWVTAAWSDNTGSFQLALSYCLRSRGSTVSRIISDVRHEVWETTREIMDKTQARWRVLLVKTEPIDQEEVDAWTALVERHNQTKPIPVELTIFSVNTTPDLYLELPPSQIPMSVFHPQASNTPVTTPHAGAPSPDQSGNATTPTSGSITAANAPTPTEASSAEPESDSILVDVCDESWGIILSHRLSNSPHITEFRPALASGYLLRRKGISDSDGVFSMSVNLIFTQRPLSTYEILLREVLGMYRDLATLARAKGTINVQRNTLPWHIATAVRAQEMLSYVL